MSHVLVARLDNAGDVLLAGPAVRAVAATATHVTLLAGPRGAEAARLLPGAGAVEVLRAPWIDLSPERVHRGWVEVVVDRLATLRCDAAVILTSSHQSSLPLALLLRMAGVPAICGISVDYPGSLLDIRVRADLEVHEVERALTVARACGYTLPPGDDTRLRVNRPRKRDAPLCTPGYVLLHPGASAPARRWHPDRWCALADLLHRQGARVVVSGTTSERHLAAGIVDAAPSAVDLTGRTDLAALTEVVAGARCLVTGNTGPAHLAAAVGTPVVSLHAPTVPASRWRPWKVPHIILGDQDLACAGCRAVRCPVPGHPCIDDVSAEGVLHAVQALTAGVESGSTIAVPA